MEDKRVYVQNWVIIGLSVISIILVTYGDYSSSKSSKDSFSKLNEIKETLTPKNPEFNFRLEFNNFTRSDAEGICNIFHCKDNLILFRGWSDEKSYVDIKFLITSRNNVVAKDFKAEINCRNITFITIYSVSGKETQTRFDSSGLVYESNEVDKIDPVFIMGIGELEITDTLPSSCSVDYKAEGIPLNSNSIEILY